MMTKPSPGETFNWQRLELEFQQATRLPGVSPGQPDWWRHWRRHLSERTTPRWFYTPEEAPTFFRQHWPTLTQCWIDAAEHLLTDLVHAGDWRPGRPPNGDIDWGANPTQSMSWAGFHYWSWANPLIRAYGLTADTRYVSEFARHQRSYFEQIDTFTPQLWHGAPERDNWRDWLVHNDLSAGIKMATFAEAVMVFRRAEGWSVDDARRATLILLRLAERLYATYKDATPTDLLRTLNFLTSGGAGLGTVAAIFPECAWSTDWLALAQRILEVHLTELYFPDGGHRELCTQYHKAGLRDLLFFEQVIMAQGKHEGYRAAFGITCVRTAYLQYGRFFLVHDVIDAHAADTDHEAQWSLQCPWPMRELDDRVAVADAFLRVQPAWPEQVHTIDMTAQGKAVWPMASDDGTTDTHRRLHQIRWCSSIPARGRTQFLMLMTANDGNCQLGAVTVENEKIDVEVNDHGMMKVVQLPLAP